MQQSQSKLKGKNLIYPLEIIKNQYFLDLAYHTLSDQKDLGHKLARYDILWNLVLLEGKFNGKEAMIKAFYEMLDFMRENIPLKDWDFSQFEFIGELIQLPE
ncbi:MAG: hypothetical protein H6577_23685 [Lewinellaceae bacterium]|nr:hypothetical protein [Saprospiraceae bacterium]MCB9341140.1 hypothetical protein [Lewinellaceae bacterium]